MTMQLHLHNHVPPNLQVRSSRSSSGSSFSTSPPRLPCLRRRASSVADEGGRVGGFYLAASRQLERTGWSSGRRRRRNGVVVVTSASGNVGVGPPPVWESWKPDKTPSSPSLSDVLWPSAGAFAAMALLGKVDQVLAPKGISMTIAPFGAVCAVLFAAPSSPAARKYNMFIAQIGCAAIGVLAFSLFGPGWLARSSALSASIAFMILMRSSHPPAASLPLLFIDGAKFHHLNFWYALFPGAAGCIILCLLQEIVCYLKDNIKF